MRTNTMQARVSAALPYVALLMVAAVLYRLTNHFDVEARPGELGPDFWPKLAIGLLAVVSLVELARALVSPRHGEVHGIADQIEATEPIDKELTDRSLPLLLGGMGLSVGYAVSLGIIGFPLATFAFLVTFMYLGRFRRHGMIWLSSFIGAALLSFLFLKVVYVSLPRGMAPFSLVTDTIISLF